MGYIKMSSFKTRARLIGNELLIGISEGENLKFDIEAFKEYFGVSQNLQMGGAITPDSVPAEQGDYFWIFAEPGTYPAFGGLVVPANSFGMVSRIGDVYKSTMTTIQPQDLSGLATKTEVNAKVSRSSIEARTTSNQLFDKTNFRANTLMASNGALNDTSTGLGAETTQDIPLDITKTHISISGLGSATHRMAFLNAAGEPITPIPSTFTTQKIGEPIPESARGFRVYYKTSAEATTARDTLMINYGLTALPYEPYRSEITKIDGKDVYIPDLTIYAKKTEVYTRGQVDSLLATKLPRQDFDELTVEVNGKNRFNPEEIQHDKLVNNSNGRLSAGAGWGCSGFIPVADLDNIAIQGDRGRVGQSFFTEPSDLAFVPDSYVSGTPSTLPVPPTANYFVMNLYEPNDPEFSNIQVEEGTTPTDYEPYINGRFIDATKIYPQPGSEGARSGIKLSMNSGDEAECYIETSLKGKVLRRGIALFRPLSPDSSQTFDFRNVYLDGVLKHGQGDNAAPYYLNGDTIGANHGFVKNRITLNAHGKTNADVGSIWTDGTKEFIIVNINDANSLDVSARLDNSSLTGNSLTHVSGATNTGAINTTTKQQMQMFPAIKNHSLKIFVDGLEVKKETSVVYGGRAVVVRENYDIMSKSSIMEWLVTQAGTTSKITQYDGTGIVRVGVDYIFDNQGGCAMPSYLLGLDNGTTSLQKVMFVMSQSMAGSKYYIPKTLPFVFEGNNYNFTNVTDLLPVAMGGRIDFTPDRVAAEGIYADRLVMLGNGLNFAIGFLPVQDAGILERPANAARKALQISDAKKVYMSAIDSAALNTITKGDYYSAIAYRNYFLPEPALTAKYIVKSNEGDYLYADWHETGINNVELPPELSGKEFSVVEKSANVSILSKENTGVITVEVSPGSNYNYLILKI